VRGYVLAMLVCERICVGNARVWEDMCWWCSKLGLVMCSESREIVYVWEDMILRMWRYDVCVCVWLRWCMRAYVWRCVCVCFVFVGVCFVFVYTYALCLCVCVCFVFVCVCVQDCSKLLCSNRAYYAISRVSSSHSANFFIIETRNWLNCKLSCLDCDA